MREEEITDSIKRILNGYTVMGHLGLTPQSIYKFGTYGVRAKEGEEAERPISDAPLCRMQELQPCWRKSWPN